MKMQAPLKSNSVKIPEIITNSFWGKSSARKSKDRTANENKIRKQAEEYFKSIGLTTSYDPENNTILVGVSGELRVEYCYIQMVSGIYKTLKITNAGKRTNITALRKYICSYQISKDK